MNRERLHQLEEMIKGIPESQLKLLSWVWLSGGEFLYVNTHGCGSVACALGFAAQYPPFVEQGLHISMLLNSPIPTVNHSASPDDGFYGYHAARVFFDLEGDQAVELFKPATTTDYVEVGSQSDKKVFLSRLRELLDPEVIPA